MKNILLLLSILPLALPLLFVAASPTKGSSSQCHHGGVVDLIYAKHIPTTINTTDSGQRVSVYKNIRFAKPPVGDLRFRKPDVDVSPTDGIQDGQRPWASTDCIASAPGFVPFPDINGTTWGQEDCLFLDVYVPESVKPGDKVPVLHFFFGSAYAFGSKDMLFSPMGLFDESSSQESNFIFVVNNYRLGVLGFMSSPDHDQDIDANVGMHDCLAAAEWTSKFIDHFGGDPDRITVVGQSAGAGIAMFSTVLDGGHGRLPFQQAFISSPAIPPRKDIAERQENVFSQILQAANCTSLDCLRGVSEETMLHVNDVLINQSPSDGGGGFLGPNPGFGLVPDGKAIPDMPEVLFREGRYHNELRSLVIGHMANEGLGLSHDTDQPEYFPTMVRQILPNASDETVAEIQSQYDYQDNPARLAWDWTTDVIFGCNGYNLARAFADKSYRYIMSTPPATHGYDLAHLFYENQETTPVGNPELAIEFRRRLLRYVHGKDMDWPIYGTKEKLMNVTEEVFREVLLPDALGGRCDTINEAVLDPINGA